MLSKNAKMLKCDNVPPYSDTLITIMATTYRPNHNYFDNVPPYSDTLISNAKMCVFL
jgi:hypothetical protein